MAGPGISWADQTKKGFEIMGRERGFVDVDGNEAVFGYAGNVVCWLDNNHMDQQFEDYASNYTLVLEETFNMRRLVDGSTFLHYAVENNWHLIAEILMSHGYNPLFKNIQGTSAKDIVDRMIEENDSGGEIEGWERISHQMKAIILERESKNPDNECFKDPKEAVPEYDLIGWDETVIKSRDILKEDITMSSYNVEGIELEVRKYEQAEDPSGALEHQEDAVTSNQYESRVIQKWVGPKGSTLYDKDGFIIEISDESSGEMVKVYDLSNSQSVPITLDKFEWPKVRDIIDEFFDLEVRG